MKFEDEKYCHQCGAIIKAQEAVCPFCNARQPGAGLPQSSYYGAAPAAYEPSRKNRLATMLLALLLPLGICGIHRMYTGDYAIGIIQFLTLGGCGVWQLVDIIQIASNNYRDSRGRKLVNG